MTDYNDGNWWGWNGGECPVHPKSQVEVRYATAEYDGIIKSKASEYDWHEFHNGNGVCAFRVVEAHREPRECWSYGSHLRDTLAEAEKFRADVDAANPGKGYGDGPITRWVEVIE